MSKFWICTASGKQFDLLNPTPEMIDIQDIARALAHLNRFTGHSGTYSVAQHSVLVSEQVPEPYKLAALLHDAAEAYVADINRPLKLAMRSMTYGKPTPYDLIEKGIAMAIAAAFGLPYPFAGVIHEADARMVLTEKRDLMPSAHGQDWELGVQPYSMLILDRWSPTEAERRFLHAYRLLQAERDDLCR